MKITKARLRQIIKEEIDTVREGNKIPSRFDIPASDLELDEGRTRWGAYYLNARVRRVNVYRDERGTVRGRAPDGRVIVIWDDDRTETPVAVDPRTIALVDEETI